MKRDCRAMAYNRVETMLRNQTAIERAVDEARAEQRGGHSGGGSSGHAFVSDPTAQQAVTASIPLRSVTLDNGYVVREPERWLGIIHYLYEHFPAADASTMRYFYDGHSAVETSMRREISERSVYNIRDDFKAMGVELACQYGLVSVVEREKKAV